MMKKGFALNDLLEVITHSAEGLCDLHMGNIAHWDFKQITLLVTSLIGKMTVKL